MGRVMEMAVRFERIDAAIEVMQHPEDLAAKWDMGTFGTQDFNDGEAIDGGNFDTPNRCNTAACFAGNLSLDPGFRRLGFRGFWEDGCLNLGKPGPERQSRDWSVGLKSVLGITYEEAEDLIAPCITDLDSWYLQNKSVGARNITVKQVVRRLQRLRRRYEKIEAEEAVGG